MALFSHLSLFFVLLIIPFSSASYQHDSSDSSALVMEAEKLIKSFNLSPKHIVTTLNAGLKNLFSGSEGSLGIVTKVSILTPPKLSSVNLAFLAYDDYFSYQKLLQVAKRKPGEILCSFEIMDNEAMDIVLNHLEGAQNPLLLQRISSSTF